MNGNRTSGLKIGAPQKREFQPQRIQTPILGPLNWVDPAGWPKIGFIGRGFGGFCRAEFRLVAICSFIHGYIYLCVYIYICGQGLVFCLPFRQILSLSWRKKCIFRPKKSTTSFGLVFFLPFPFFCLEMAQNCCFCLSKRQKKGRQKTRPPLYIYIYITTHRKSRYYFPKGRVSAFLHP